MSGRPFTILGAIIAVLALGAFLFFGTRSSGNPGLGPTTVNLKPMVVAARDIQVRVPLTIADVKIIRVDAGVIPPNSFDKVEQLKGLIPVVSILQGQPVTGNQLLRRNQGLPVDEYFTRSKARRQNGPSSYR